MRLPYTKLAPEAYEAMLASGHVLNVNTALESNLLELVRLRSSFLNGCEFCLGAHQAELTKHNEPQSRIDAVADWQSSDAFTLRERAALAWTDAITNIQDNHASDVSYSSVTEFFQGKDLVDLTFAIAQINAWNRLSVAFAVEWNPPASKTAAAL